MTGSSRGNATTAPSLHQTHAAALKALIAVASAAAIALGVAALGIAPGQALAAQRFPQLESEVHRTDAVPLLIEVELDSEAVKAEAMEAIRYWRQDALDNGIVTEKELADDYGTTREEYLNDFEWSAELETIAIQRSAETRIFWDHIRPDGSSCFSLTDKGWYTEEGEWHDGPAGIDSGGEVVSSNNLVSGGISQFASERYAYIREKNGEKNVGVTGHYTFLILNCTSKKRDVTAVYGFGNASSLVGEGTTTSNDYASWTNAPAGYKGTYDVTVRVKDFTCTDYWGKQQTFNVSIASAIAESRIRIGETTNITTTATVTKNGEELNESWERHGQGFRVAADGMQYKSSNEAVAKVSSDGVVTGVGEGKATITVSGGTETAKVTVEVVQGKLVSIAKPQVHTLLNTQPAMPKTVEATWNVGKPSQEPVSWDAVNDSKLAAKGSFAVKGTVTIASYDNSVHTTQATVIVEANVARLFGNNALKTMQKIVGFNTGKPREYGNVFEANRGGTVLIAANDGYWDALTASALAGLQDTCVLMTAPNELSAETKAEIERLAPERIYVCGGEKTIYDEVKKALEAYAPVKRLSGTTAASTAVALFEEGAKQGTWSDTAVVATSDGYWDALSISSFAYAKNAPIFLTNGTHTLSDETLAAIKKGGFKHVLIVGGDLSVAPSVEKQLGTLFEKRLKGDNAIATSAEIANYELAHGMGNEGFGVATAEGYWDALCGAALCGKKNAVLVLALPGRNEAIDAAIAGKGADITLAYVFGGEASINADTYNYLRSKL